MAIVGRVSEQFSLRLPIGLRDRIKAAAATHGRSINSEIALLLLREYGGQRTEPATTEMVEEARAIWGDKAAAQLAEKLEKEVTGQTA